MEPKPNTLPLFFKNPKLLNPKPHKDAGVKQDLGLGFAKKTNSIIITSAEFIEAAKFYPVVFTNGENPLPVVIVGLESENYFVDKKGAWKEDTYIPAYTRQYPFVFVELQEAKQLSLCIDEGSEQYTANAKGDKTLRLFEKDGQPSQFTKNALEFCGAIQKHHVYTQAFAAALNELKLFTPQQMEAKTPGGRTIRMDGFQVIDQEKLRTLPDDKIAELHKKGFLPLIYFINLSMSNWGRLLQMAENATPSKKSA